MIDDVGLLPVSPDAAEALFRVVDAGYEKRSIALTSNLHPAGFDANREVPERFDEVAFAAAARAGDAEVLRAADPFKRPQRLLRLSGD